MLKPEEAGFFADMSGSITNVRSKTDMKVSKIDVPVCKMVLLGWKNEVSEELT